MNRNVVETLMGALVIIVALAFVIRLYQSVDVGGVGSNYTISARFKEVGTLGIGSDVRVGGIRIGSVTTQRLDTDTFRAIVDITINDNVKLPKDSTAAIVSDGLLGGKYVSIEPGADNVNLTDGDELRYTQDAVNLESLIGKFAFGSVNSDKKGDDSSNEDEKENSAIPSL